MNAHFSLFDIPSWCWFEIKFDQKYATNVDFIDVHNNQTLAIDALDEYRLRHIS